MPRLDIKTCIVTVAGSGTGFEHKTQAPGSPARTNAAQNLPKCAEIEVVMERSERLLIQGAAWVGAGVPGQQARAVFHEGHPFLGGG